MKGPAGINEEGESLGMFRQVAQATSLVEGGSQLQTAFAGRPECRRTIQTWWSRLLFKKNAVAQLWLISARSRRCAADKLAALANEMAAYPPCLSRCCRRDVQMGLPEKMGWRD